LSRAHRPAPPGPSPAIGPGALTSGGTATTIVAMDSFAGRLAVVTGGGSGMGRELVRQLAAQGCSVATCDWHEGTLAETTALARAGTTLVRMNADFRDRAPVSAARAAAIILDGVRSGPGGSSSARTPG